MKLPEDWYSKETTAYHEASHAVIAHEVGGWIAPGGVRIGTLKTHGALGIAHTFNFNDKARIYVNMAGLLAEEKLLGLRSGWEKVVFRHIRAVRAGREEERPFPFGPTDSRNIAIILVRLHGSAAWRWLYYYRHETKALLDHPEVWGGVERLAKALLQHHHLSPEAVEQLLGIPVGIERQKLVETELWADQQLDEARRRRAHLRALRRKLHRSPNAEFWDAARNWGWATQRLERTPHQ